MERDRRGVTDVEGVHAPSHGDPPPEGRRGEGGRVEPGSLAAEDEGDRGGECVELWRVRSRRQGHRREAGPLRPYDELGSGSTPPPRDERHRAHRHPHAPAAPRVGAGGVEEELVDAEGRRRAEDRTEVLGVADPHEDADDGGRCRRSRSPTGERAEDPTVDREPGDLVEPGSRHHLDHRSEPSDEIGTRRGDAFDDEGLQRLATRLEDPLDDREGLGDEDPLGGLEPPPEAMIPEVAEERAEVGRRSVHPRDLPTPPSLRSMGVPDDRMQPTAAVRGAGERRRRLNDVLQALETAIDLPASDPRWRQVVAGHLADLVDALDEHVREVERPGGMFDEILAEAPRLEPEVRWFIEDHRRLAERVAELAERVHREDPAIMRDLVSDLVRDLHRHRQRGADLVYEAYSVDIGGW